MSFETWKDGLSTICEGFQMDLSCLVDSELDAQAAGRAMMHMEACAACREFFEDTRTQIRLHKDTADPDRIFARVAMLTGRGLPDAETVEGIDLVHRLATIFYQLGKAYVLAAIDPGYRERVFESAVPVDATQARGRGFVDGVVMQGKDEAGGLDWKRARSMLNGRLERIQSPLEKGRKLLEEAIATDSSNEEAQLYLAFLHAHEGRKLVAAEEYQRIFETALDERNRGHAAIQLGRLHSAEKSYSKAIALWRWVTMTGLAEQDDRFFVARFNLGMVYALQRNQSRSLGYFRQLIDRHPAMVGEVAELFRRSQGLREAIDSQSGFAEALVRTCPELFVVPAGQAGAGDAEPEEA
ncbi:MAG TPA: tetratricopeptide repeat protein [Planctomycetota bacterium]|jgi:tetratricopeptide (TPR) repeat protein|nr:tetratricopeptide repeat protein [Planctomycetota bacterium]